MAHRRTRDEAARRRAGAVGVVGVVAAAVLPAVLWADVIADVARASAQRHAADVLLGWTPWLLMGLGLLCAIPVAVTSARARRSRFHRPGGGAWAGWGVTLYVLGFGLATQVAQLHGLGAS